MITKERCLRGLMVPVVVLIWFATQLVPAAAAPGDVSDMTVAARLDRAGVLAVQETLTFDGAAPASVTQRLATRENTLGDAAYVYDISNISARSGDREVQLQVTTTANAVEIDVPTQGLTEPVTIAYQVSGATQQRTDGTILTWRLLQGLSVPVADFTATIEVPTPLMSVDCQAGPPNADAKCTSATGGTAEAPRPQFTDGPRGAGEMVNIAILFGAGSVEVTERLEYRWTLARAFSAEPLQLGLALGLLVLGGIVVWLLHRRASADPSTAGTISPIAEFAPVGEGQSEFRVTSNVRPGEVGTLVDERVDPTDIVATVVDLAVRGKLLITEETPRSAYAAADWTFTRQPAQTEPAQTEPGTQLQPYEQRLLDTIAPSDGTAVRVSTVGNRIAEAIGEVQSELYDEMVTGGWYEERPDATRSGWQRIAIGLLVGSIVVTGLLAAFTTFGLVGLALIVLTLGLLFVAQEMPSRTPKGDATVRGLEALRSELLSRSTAEAPKGREFESISKVLPYAIVLGGAERWVNAMVAADDDDRPDPTDLSWYHAPADWHLSDLPDSLKNFVTTLAGTLTER